MALKTNIGSEEKLMSSCWKPFTLRGQIKKKRIIILTDVKDWLFVKN